MAGILGQSNTTMVLQRLLNSGCGPRREMIRAEGSSSSLKLRSTKYVEVHNSFVARPLALHAERFNICVVAPSRILL